MKLPRVQLNLWQIMVMVAIFAMAFAIPGAIERRRLHFLDLARFHSERAARYGNSGHSYIIYRGPKPTDPGRRRDAEIKSDKARARRMVAMGFYHIGLQSKYRAAAERPWLPVFPDPPEPK